jgi:DNA-binding CsgD family transcriptional regulator
MEWQCFSEAHYIYLAWGKQTNDTSKLIKAYEYLLAERNITEQQSRINHKEKLDAVTNKYELKQKALSEKLAQQEIDALKTEVQSISFNLNEKIQVLDEIKMYVNSLKKKEHEARQLLNTIARKINSVKITEEEKATLQFKISEVNQQITKILSEKYPALSTMEIRMCGLFQSGITNKELAKMYGQSEKSYEQHRYRIKKKMGLGAKDNLVKHLTALYLTAK